MTIYQELTEKFNTECIRAILAGGQAVVMHRLAFMSKDGDWIIREDERDVAHVLQVLESYGAKYRFGAPLDARWLSGGWSAHLEFQWEGLRIRTDFVSKPPRIDAEMLRRMWHDAEHQPVPFAGAADLAAMKKTNREKDYVVIGELARKMNDPADQLLYSRSARDLLSLSQQYPDLVRSLAGKRSLLNDIGRGRDHLESALDRERRKLMRANEERLARYLEAAKPWSSLWPRLSCRLQGLTLAEAHRMMIDEAAKNLPMTVPGGWP